MDWWNKLDTKNKFLILGGGILVLLVFFRAVFSRGNASNAPDLAEVAGNLADQQQQFEQMILGMISPGGQGNPADPPDTVDKPSITDPILRDRLAAFAQQGKLLFAKRQVDRARRDQEKAAEVDKYLKLAESIRNQTKQRFGGVYHIPEVPLNNPTQTVVSRPRPIGLESPNFFNVKIVS